jgi:hypothetical protein
MQRWKLVTILVLVFVLGALAGVLGTGLALRYYHPFGPRDPAARKAFIMQRLERRLSLDADQKQRVAAIVDRFQAQAGERFRAHRQEWQALLNQGFSEIRRELNPGQQERLDALRSEFEARLQKRGARFAPPPKL